MSCVGSGVQHCITQDSMADTAFGRLASIHEPDKSQWNPSASDADCWARLHEQLSSLRENVKDLADRTISPRLHQELRSCARLPEAPVEAARTAAAASVAAVALASPDPLPPPASACR